ncbi:pectate lyase [Tundrisphaera sp. TA3]|uniref:pectate lyase n=1 Tax=Tundrisphaera sp. TA3 TaxID=3435775 RepID=UPI003EB8047B
MTRSLLFRLSLFLAAIQGGGHPEVRGAEPPLREQAVQAMRKAAGFYRGRVASHGGYAYYTRLDLKQRWGEGKLDADTIVVQPPGTPAVGMAYLEAFAATGDRFYLDAAREAAEALVAGQLESGGWTQTISFAPGKPVDRYRKRKGGAGKNISSLDDGQTQSAIQFLARVDKALDFRHAEIHEAALYAVDALLKAQFPSGAFPQVWTGPVAAKPVVRARYPEGDWRSEGRVKDYWNCPTLNDNLASTVAETLIAVHQVYGDAKSRAALERLGDFLVLAQMPDPQPAWCQQYHPDTMAPIWARKFEPPAVTGWESQGVMETLMRIARETGNKAYLDPIPRALAYLKRSQLPGGRVARFYELKSNRPLFMDADYQLTYDDSAAPSHYGWVQPSRLDGIEKAYRAAREGVAPRAEPARPSPLEVRRIIGELDAQGRWVSTFAGERLVGQPKLPMGLPYLSSEVFIDRLTTLARFVGDRPK